jgi:hypothetical protein
LTTSLAAGYSPDDEQGFRSRGDGIGKWSVGEFKRQVFFTGKKPQERSASLRDLVANRPPEHRMACFQNVQHRAKGHRTLNAKYNFAVDAGKRPKMCRKSHTNHGSV